jgi:putative spermidine/putrescine transport system ATP-binding protein
MRKGAIAQIGKPREIYFAPASRFVAEFIGAANIFAADYAAGVLTLAGAKLPLANGAANGAAVAMIRPESIKVVSPDGAMLAGCVDNVSFVGDRQRLTVSGVGGKTILVDAPNSIDIKAGERVGLEFDTGAIRLLPRDAP